MGVSACIRPALVGALAVVLSACATCVPYQKVGVESTPAGADVYLDGELVGQTPLRLTLVTSSDHAVFLKKHGYRPELVVVAAQGSADGLNFLTPADVRVRLTPLPDPSRREVELDIED